MIAPFIGAAFYLFDLPLPVDTSIDGIPDPKKFAMQLLFCMLMEDLVFHFSHRMLHHPRLYPHIHKIHHEHKVTVSFSSQYAHPIEYIFGNVLPATVGPLILDTRMHFTVASTWYFLRSLESCEGHSGYEFPWSPFRLLPFGIDFGYHEYHHSHNIGNYSSFFSIWDSVFGSNSAYYEFLKERRSPAAVTDKKQD